MPESTTRTLAAALSELDASQDAAQHAALLLADHLALVAAATDAATAERRAELRGADRAALDAELGAIGDRDDVHWGRLVHPGAIVWPVVLTLGEQRDLPGTALLRAARIGYETCVLLASALDDGLRPALHATAATGAVAAAAAASALSGDGRVHPDALGHALSVGWGSSAALRELSGTRAFHRAHAVRTGMAAADAAARGLTATMHQLDTPPGAPWAPSELQPTGTALAETSIRVFPTSGWNQTAFEAARAAARPGRLHSIAVTVGQVVIDRSQPSADAWNSLETAVAAGAAAGSGDPRPLAELLPLVTVTASAGGLAAVAEVETSGGHDRAEVSVPSGHPTRPAAIEDLAVVWSTDAATASARIARIAHLLTSSEPGAARAIRAVAAPDPRHAENQEHR